MIELEHVSKKFRKKEALRDLSFTFEQGVYGLLGPNGAGKTTLMRCMTGLYDYKGDIRYDGAPVGKSASYLKQVGYLPQKFGMFKELTVKDMMLYFANLKKIDKKKAMESVKACVETVNLTDRMDSRVGALSGGMVRRLGIAQALLGEPKTLVFDEPTAGLDPEERMRFKNIITGVSGSRTVLLSTHIVEDVEAVCDQVVLMDQGRILHSGNCGEIAALAKGKVYECPQEEAAGIKGKFYVQRQLERDGKRVARILAQEPQPFRPVEPEIEDGYLCAVKRI